MHEVFGGSSGQAQSSSTPSNMQNPAFSALAPGVASNLQALFQGGPAFTGVGSAFAPNVGGASPVTNDTNPLVAALSPNSLGLVNQGTAQGAVTPAENAAGSYYNTVLNPNFPAQLATSPQTAAAISAAVNPMIQAFRTTTMPGLQGQFINAGQSINPNAGPGNPVGGSSAFGNAAGIAQTGLQQAIGSASSNIANTAYQTGLQLQANAGAQAPALSAAELQQTLNSLQASTLPQMIQQYGINQALSLYQQRVQTMLQSLGLGAQAAQPVVANTQQGSGSSDSENGIIPDIAGFFHSDRRLKDNIRQVGTATNGLPIYAYNYKGSKVTHLGFMADEVATVHPEAVTDIDGFQAVNYDKAVL